MFIKFGDKTKKVVVKGSRDGLESESNKDDDSVVYMDEDADDRRVKALKEYGLPKKLHKTSK
tara:strand:+ start:3489 stop:3674 length:186 start_codon:yes stop_codon:yes gene_type:complete